jgi:transposase
MNKAHEIKLNPTAKQRNLFAQACGISRHSFNWGLAKWDEMYKAGEKPSAMNLIKLQNSIKKEATPFYLNAAINLANYSPTAKSAESQAFGEVAEPRKVQSKSMKNEITKLSNKIVLKSTLS